MRSQIISVIAVTAILLAGIPGSSFAISKKLKKANARYAKLQGDYDLLKAKYQDCRDSLVHLAGNIQMLSAQLDDQRAQLKEQKASNEQTLNHLKDLSVISGSQATSINKFLESMGAKDAYIRDLQEAITRRDSITLALAMNLKSVLADQNDKDIDIKIEKGVIYVNISDKMLFRTGKYQVAAGAKEVLEKVAKILMAHPELDLMVEGNTDNVPYREGVLQDNWDLSVKRATSVARILQNDYGIPPSRITAAGRGEYLPVAPNETDYGRALNRRTRIIILPQLDQFYQLLEKTK